jgi:hypothetical protein
MKFSYEPGVPYGAAADFGTITTRDADEVRYRSDGIVDVWKGGKVVEIVSWKVQGVLGSVYMNKGLVATALQDVDHIAHAAANAAVKVMFEMAIIRSNRDRVSGPAEHVVVKFQGLKLLFTGQKSFGTYGYNYAGVVGSYWVPELELKAEGDVDGYRIS